MRSNGLKLSNINLKGKLHKTLSCGCCDAYNFKNKCLDKIHDTEIQYYIDNGIDDENFERNGNGWQVS